MKFLLKANNPNNNHIKPNKPNFCFCIYCEISRVQFTIMSNIIIHNINIKIKIKHNTTIHLITTSLLLILITHVKVFLHLITIISNHHNNSNNPIKPLLKKITLNHFLPKPLKHPLF